MWEDYYRKQANQRRAELQQVLHRSSALCTLAHALLLDQAANDPMLQVWDSLSMHEASCSLLLSLHIIMPLLTTCSAMTSHATHMHTDMSLVCSRALPCACRRCVTHC